MTTVYFNYSEHTYGGEICKYEDPYDRYASHEPKYTEVSWEPVVKITDGAKYPFDQYDLEYEVVPGDKVWAAIAYCTTGSTFGSQHGIPNIMLVSIDEDEVSSYIDRAEEDYAKNGRDIEGGWNSKKDLEFGYNVPWKGYFEGLDDIEMRMFTVV